jgi:hypothetical protein
MARLSCEQGGDQLQSTAMIPRLAVTLILACLPLLAGGCAQRTITVTSEPAGALVWLNDQEVGRTPVTVPFTFYGTYDVRLEADGHEALWTQRRLAGPLWELPGPDLIGEALGFQSHHVWHFVLDEQRPPDEQAIIDRALQMRASIRQDAQGQAPPEPGNPQD